MIVDALRLVRLLCLGIVQLELLNAAFDRSHNGEQMQQLLYRIDARLKLDRFPPGSLSSYG